MHDEIDLRIVFRNLWRRKALLPLFLALFIGLAYTYLHFKKPRYLASSKFAVKTTEDKAAGQLRSLAALAGINVGGGSSMSPDILFAELLLDDEFLGRLLEKKWRLGSDSVTLPDLWKLQPDSTKPDWPYRLRKQQVEKLRDGAFIKMEKNKTTGIISLKTLFIDPGLALQVNEHVLAMFDEFMIEHQISQAGAKKKFIEARIREVEKDLFRSEQALVDFQMRNKDVTAPTALMEMIRLKRNTEINQELFLQLKKQFELVKIEEKDDQPLIQMVSKPVLPVSPAKPNRKLVIGAAVALGLLAGLGAMVLHYAWAVFTGRASLTTGPAGG